MEIFRLFKSDWPIATPSKKTENTSMSCTSCVDLEQQVQEKHELVLTLVNKGNDVQKQLQASQEKEVELQNEIEKLKNSNEKFFTVLQEYESNLHDAIQVRNLAKEENEQNKKHLMNLEYAFSDLHEKYEKSKSVIEINRENEIALWESIKENERTIIDLNHKYEKLKEESINKLNSANETINKMQVDQEEEINRYKTKVKTLEIKIDSLEKTIKQKCVENEKLSSICEEFIKKLN